VEEDDDDDDSSRSGGGGGSTVGANDANGFGTGEAMLFLFLLLLWVSLRVVAAGALYFFKSRKAWQVFSTAVASSTTANPNPL
jgi:hypothetical protein